MAYELFFDGFDQYAAPSEMTKQGWVFAFGTGSIAASAGRRGSKAFASGGNTDIFALLPSASTHVVVGFALSMPASTCTIQLRSTGNAAHGTVIINTGGFITFTPAGGGSPTLTSSNTFPISTYMFVEIGLVVGDSGTIEVRVNGSAVGWIPSATADTKNGAATTVGNILWDFSTGTAYLDDVYLAFGDELKWLGDSRVDVLPLTGNSTPQDWTPDTGNAWERLLQDAGYVESATDEASSLFGVTDLGYSPLTLHGVEVIGLVKKSDAGYREACVLLDSNGTVQESAAVALSTDTLPLRKVWTTNPATGLAWSLPAVQAIKAGLRVKA